MGLLDDFLKGLKGEKKSEFMSQILKEKAFYDELKRAGLTIVVEDPRERARIAPHGILSKGQKIDLVDLITKIIEIVTIGTVVNISLIDVIQKVVEITTIKTIENILSPVDPYSLTSKVKGLDKIEATYDGEGNISTIKGFEGEDQKYLLTFTWEAGAWKSVVRT